MQEPTLGLNLGGVDGWGQVRLTQVACLCLLGSVVVVPHIYENSKAQCEELLFI